MMKKLLACLMTMMLCLACIPASAMEVTPTAPDASALTQAQAIDLARTAMLSATPDYINEYVMPQLDKDGQLDVKATHGAVTHEGKTYRAWIVTFYTNAPQNVFLTASVTLDAATGNILWEDYSYSGMLMRELWNESLGYQWTPEDHAAFDALYGSPLAPVHAVLPQEHHIPTDKARQLALDHLVMEYGVAASSLTDHVSASYELLEKTGLDGQKQHEWRVTFYSPQGLLLGQVNMDASTGDIHLTYSITQPGNG